MPFVITDPCIGTKDAACIDVCPVDCIHPRKDEPEFEQATMLYIHPEECIDCGACVPACPVAAIYDSVEVTPSHQTDLIEANSIYRSGDPDAVARAESHRSGPHRRAANADGHPARGTTGGPQRLVDSLQQRVEVRFAALAPSALRIRPWPFSWPKWRERGAG